MTEKQAWIAFSTFPFIGPKRFRLLVDYFGSARGAWEAPKKELGELGIGSNLLEKFERHRQTFSLEEYLGRLERLGIDCITMEDEEYPERLKKIDDAPFLLYVKGIENLKFKISNSTCVAVVGTRKSSSYGQDVCRRLVAGLCDAGVTIVSGLALGTDAWAHKAALEAGGQTIAVLGNGLSTVYPASNRGLARAILDRGQGLIFSEYPLDYPARPENFPVRNRIVSGMSLAVLVIEGTAKSGTLLTAALAAKQGRDVFAVPGPITSPMSAAPHLLIKNGAKLVEKVEDVLDELNIELRIKNNAARNAIGETVEERKILELLEKESLSVDGIVRVSGLQTGAILSSLTGMELKGMVRKVGDEYILNSK